MKNMDNLPKILIIGGYTFEEANATSITLKNIFSAWSIEKLAFIYVTNQPDNLDSKKNIFTVFKRKFANIQINRQEKSFINDIRSAKSVVGGVMDATASNDKKTKILNFFHTSIISHYALIPYKYSDKLDKFIQEFQPDFIYTPLGSLGIMHLAYKISIKYNIPIYPHFMDDWINTMYTKNIFLIIPCLVKKYYLKKIFDRTEKAFAISEKMASEYSNNYKKLFFPLMNCVDDLTSSEELDIDDTALRFCYSGGLHLNRWKSLEFLCKGLEGLNSDKPIELNIFTKESDWQLFKDKFINFSFVHYMGFISQAEMLHELKKQTILVHIESFDKKVSAYTRLSISTKIPEYLSMKKPILAIGPSDIVSIEYLNTNQSAFVVDRQEEELLKNEIKKIMNSELRKEVAMNAYNLFRRNHTKKSQQQVLRNNVGPAKSRL
jgi:hypothetical protein